MCLVKFQGGPFHFIFIWYMLMVLIYNCWCLVEKTEAGTNLDVAETRTDRLVPLRPRSGLGRTD